MSRDTQNSCAERESAGWSSASNASSGSMDPVQVTVLVSVGKSIEREGHEKDCDKHPLYFLRRERGWTLKDLAEMSGVDQACICNYELGQRSPTIESAFKLAIALDTTVDRLFGVPHKRNARAAVAG